MVEWKHKRYGIMELHRTDAGPMNRQRRSSSILNAKIRTKVPNQKKEFPPKTINNSTYLQNNGDCLERMDGHKMISNGMLKPCCSSSSKQAFSLLKMKSFLVVDPRKPSTVIPSFFLYIYPLSIVDRMTHISWRKEFFKKRQNLLLYFPCFKICYSTKFEWPWALRRTCVVYKMLIM